jgi:methionyl aminopeptidase
MVMMGTKNLRLLKDGWTQISENRRQAAHFEHTVAITATGPVRLTAQPTGEELEWVSPEFRDPAQWVKW